MSGERVRDVEDRVGRFLGEFRMLVTAVGVLVAFDLQAAFSSPALEADVGLQAVLLVATVFAVSAFACLLVPASVHRLASQVGNADRFIGLARGAITLGFLFLGVSLVLSVFVQASRAVGWGWGGGVAGLVSAVLVVAWSIVPRWFERVCRVAD